MKNSSAFAIQPAAVTGQRLRPLMQTGQCHGLESGNPLPGISFASLAELKAKVRDASVDVAKLVAASAASLGCGWLASWLVSAGCDGVSDMIRTFGRQPEFHQGVLIAVALWFAVVPFCCSFVFGGFKAKLNGSVIWNAVPTVLVLFFACCDFMFTDGALEDLVELSPWIALALVTAYGGMLSGQRLMKGSRQ